MPLAIGLLIGVIGAIGRGTPVAACSCLDLSPREQYELAAVVFVGTVVDDWSQPPPTSGEYSSDLPRWLTFETTEVYKGEVFATQTIRTSTDVGGCGLELRGTGPFLMFAGGVGTEYLAELCGGSRLLEPDGVPRAFGDPTAPVPGTSWSSRPDLATTTSPPPDVQQGTVLGVAPPTTADRPAPDPSPTVAAPEYDEDVAEEGSPVDMLATFGVPVLIVLAALAAFVIVRSARHH